MIFTDIRVPYADWTHLYVSALAGGPAVSPSACAGPPDHMALWHGSGSAHCVGPRLGTGPACAAAHTSRLTATLDLHPERMQVTDISALAEVWPACSQEPGGPPSCRAPVWVLLSLRSKTSSTRCQSEFCRGRRVDDRVCWFLLLGSRACSVCTTTQGLMPHPPFLFSL